MSFFTSTFVGKIIASIFICMVPVIELRGGIPYAVAMGIDPALAMILAIIGNLLPIPFILFFLDKVLVWMKNWGGIFSKIANAIEKRGREKGKKIENGLVAGLILFVAIPLPGTGAWTGALVASVLKIPFKKAFPAIIIGVVIAAVVVTIISYGVSVLI